jgi:hypothetical protein
MKKFFILYICLLICLPVSARAEVFFNTLYDVPVMPGLSEVPDMALSFDKPAGRIAQAGAIVGELSEESIYSFYEQSLKQLGWQAQQGNIYVRDGEKLEISIRKTGQSAVVQFMLRPL